MDEHKDYVRDGNNSSRVTQNRTYKMGRLFSIACVKLKEDCHDKSAGKGQRRPCEGQSEEKWRNNTRTPIYISTVTKMGKMTVIGNENEDASRNRDEVD